MDELYEFVEFKQDGESYLVLTKKGSYKKFIEPGKRSAVICTAHSRKHLGYTEMCRELEDCIWPEMYEDFKDFLVQCRCALRKQNNRKTVTWVKPKEIPEIKETDAAYSIDLYSWKNKK